MATVALLSDLSLDLLLERNFMVGFVVGEEDVST